MIASRWNQSTDVRPRGPREFPRRHVLSLASPLARRRRNTPPESMIFAAAENECPGVGSACLSAAAATTSMSDLQCIRPHVDDHPDALAMCPRSASSPSETSVIANAPASAAATPDRTAVGDEMMLAQLIESRNIVLPQRKTGRRATQMAGPRRYASPPSHDCAAQAGGPPDHPMPSPIPPTADCRPNLRR